MGKFLVKLLTSVLDKYSKHTVKDSFQIVDKLKQMFESKLENSCMVSYRIKHIFTNISVLKVIQICFKELYHSYLVTLKYQNSFRYKFYKLLLCY